MNAILQFPVEATTRHRETEIVVPANRDETPDAPRGSHPESYYTSVHDMRSATQAYRVTISRLALSAGLHDQQLALLEIVRGHPLYPRATIGDIAHDFRHEHHTVSALVTRAEKEGLIVRVRGPRNVAYPVLTLEGQKRLDAFIFLAITEGADPLQRCMMMVTALFQRFLEKPGRDARSL